MKEKIQKRRKYRRTESRGEKTEEMKVEVNERINMKKKNVERRNNTRRNHYRLMKMKKKKKRSVEGRKKNDARE